MKFTQRGFNIIELMLALTVAGILLGVGVPALRDFSLRQRMTTSAQDLRTDLLIARPSDDGASCTGATDWARGRIVFSDPNGNGTVDAGDTIVRQSAALAGEVTANSALSAATFGAMGTHTAGPFVINLCRTDQIGINIRIRRSGHASSEKTNVVCP
jgi:prepilin-type N-terminal cleavage/methylation domain-containing protein